MVVKSMKQTNKSSRGLETGQYSTLSKALTTVNTSNFPAEARARVYLPETERVRNWFIEPLKKFSGDDAIVCMMIMLPLLEKITRVKCGLKSRQRLDAKAMCYLGKSLGISSADAKRFWDCFRNGLMHRAMMKDALSYTLSPESGPGSVIEFDGDIAVIYVWRLRDSVVTLLKHHGKQLWKDADHPIPEVH